MTGRASEPSPARAPVVFVVAGFLCVLALALNIAEHLGWIGVRVPLVSGFGARWALTLAAAVCFVAAWYSERGAELRGK